MYENICIYRGGVAPRRISHWKWCLFRTSFFSTHYTFINKCTVNETVTVRRSCYICIYSAETLQHNSFAGCSCNCCNWTLGLTLWGRNKMATILLTIFEMHFWQKNFECWLKFHWSLFLNVLITITLVPVWRQASGGSLTHICITQPQWVIREADAIRSPF